MNASPKLANRLIIIDTGPIVKHSRFIEIFPIDPLQRDDMQRHTGLISEVMIPFDLKLKATVYITGSMDYGADGWILA